MDIQGDTTYRTLIIIHDFKQLLVLYYLLPPNKRGSSSKHLPLFQLPGNFCAQLSGKVIGWNLTRKGPQGHARHSSCPVKAPTRHLFLPVCEMPFHQVYILLFVLIFNHVSPSATCQLRGKQARKLSFKTESCPQSKFYQQRALCSISIGDILTCIQGCFTPEVSGWAGLRLLNTILEL